MASPLFQVVGERVWKFWQETFNPLAAGVNDLGEADKKIYESMVKRLREASERIIEVGETAKPLDHYIVIKRVESWGVVKRQLRLIRTLEQLQRKDLGILDPTPIENWTTKRISFINTLKEFDQSARISHEAQTQQTPLANGTTLEQAFLSGLKKCLEEGKAEFDKDAENKDLLKNLKCATLINRVRHTWDYLSVFSADSWREVATINSNGTCFIIISCQKAGPNDKKTPPQVESELDGATKAVFTITETGVIVKTPGHIQATGVKLSDRAFTPIEPDSEYDKIVIGGPQQFYDVDPKGLRPVCYDADPKDLRNILQPCQPKAAVSAYAKELKQNLLERATELSEFAKRSTATAKLVITAVNASLTKGGSAYTDLEKEPATLLAWIWISPKKNSSQQSSTDDDAPAKILTVAKANLQKPVYAR